MRRVIFFLIAAIVVIAIAFGIASLPGHVSGQFGNLSIEAPTSVAALACLIVLLVFYVLFRLLGGLLGFRRRFRAWRAGRNRAGGDRAVTRALLALAAGEGGNARRAAAAARRLLGDTPQTLLLAAEAARLAGGNAEAESLFRTLAAQKEGAFLGLRGLLRQAIADEHWSEAARLARQAEAAHPGTTWLRHERQRLAIETKDWRGALALADPPARAALATAAAEAEPDPDAALRLAREAVAADPALPAAALALARLLRRAGKEKRVEAVIRTAWEEAPHPDLAAFALEPIADPLARATAAQRLTARNPNHPESRFLLAATALAAGLTGEARRHAEALRTEGVAWRRLLLLLAHIARTEAGGKESAAEHDALEAAAATDANPTWRCDACGATAPAWQPVCPACHAVGRLRWSSPPLLHPPVPAAPLLHAEGGSG